MAAGDWKEFYRSAQEGDLELVKYHIAMGIDPNHQHPEFMTTALIASIEQQHYEVAAFLLKSGSDPNRKEDYGHHTPLSIALSTKNERLIELVKSYQ